tara:strand:+ start:15328 stop:16194 length:867 start_codon:yes stop_codon:yes gene_type:complete
MKNRLNSRFNFLGLLSVLLFALSFQSLNAQNKVRLKAQYNKIMDSVSYVDIVATSKIDKENVNVSDIEIFVFNELEDDNIELGKLITNHNGKGRFIIENLNAIQTDSSNTFNLLFTFKGNETFKRAKKGISFKNAEITAKIVVKDSINYVEATLTDLGVHIPIVEQGLTIRVQRLFGPLILGKEFNNTDDDGSILVPIEEGIPGVNGNLIFEVVLKDSDDYGTVKALIKSSIGTPIVDESTFNERTMWSTRDKTPIFLLIFPNLLIFGIWGLIIYLIVNLFKISKSKT